MVYRVKSQRTREYTIVPQLSFQATCTQGQSNHMQEILGKLVQGHPLNEEESARAIGRILRGQANESQVGAMLALLSTRGPTLDEIVGGAREMRRHAVTLPLDGADPIREHLIDTCGTGGTAKTFNISTAAAIVAAAARAKDGQRVFVAKHDGRSRSGRGSTEVLNALGVNVDAPPDVQVKCLRQVGVCFSFAVNHHPAMKFAAGPRKSLGFPTIFNLLGPLTNPACAKRQLMGVYDKKYVPLIAEALARLGAQRAMVVHSDDGMDEISIGAPTMIAHVHTNDVSIETFDASSVGLAHAKVDDLRVSTLDQAVDLMRRIIAGQPGAAADVVILNAGAAIAVGGAAHSIAEGVIAAREALASGRAKETLEMLAQLSHST